MKFSVIPILILVFAELVVGQIDTPVFVKPKELSKRVLSKKFLDVPSEVRSFHGRGTIYVVVAVDEVGAVTKVQMLSGFSHISFMREYIESEVSSWKFKPLKKNGNPVRYRGVVPIPFLYGTFPKKMPD